MRKKVYVTLGAIAFTSLLWIILATITLPVICTSCSKTLFDTNAIKESNRGYGPTIYTITFYETVSYPSYLIFVYCNDSTSVIDGGYYYPSGTPDCGDQHSANITVPHPGTYSWHAIGYNGSNYIYWPGPTASNTIQITVSQPCTLRGMQ